MTEEMARDHLEDLFQLLISRLCKEKWRSKEQGRYLWWFPRITRPNICIKHCLGGKQKIRIGVLVSNLGVLDDEFEVSLAAGKLSKVRSWYKKLGLHGQTNRYTVIKWIVFDKACTPLKWAHLNKRPDYWEEYPSCLGVSANLWRGGDLKCREEAFE